MAVAVFRSGVCSLDHGEMAVDDSMGMDMSHLALFDAAHLFESMSTTWNFG